VHAKRTLEPLAALVTPTATVIRDGEPAGARVEKVVDGDIVMLERATRSLQTGRCSGSDGLALDESILTGEPAPVSRARARKCGRGRSPSRAAARTS